MTIIFKCGVPNGLKYQSFKRLITSKTLLDCILYIKPPLTHDSRVFSPDVHTAINNINGFFVKYLRLLSPRVTSACARLINTHYSMAGPVAEGLEISYLFTVQIIINFISCP